METYTKLGITVYVQGEKRFRLTQTKFSWAVESESGRNCVYIAGAGGKHAGIVSRIIIGRWAKMGMDPSLIVSMAVNHHTGMVDSRKIY